MIPHFFHGHNHVFQAPAGWDVEIRGECSPLPVMIDSYGLTSVWKPSATELAALNAGGGISIIIAQHTQPVMGVGVVDANCLLMSA